MWLARIKYESENGIEDMTLTAPTKQHLYVKLYKTLNLNWLEVLIHRNMEK
jgi:hypothetical protein